MSRIIDGKTTFTGYCVGSIHHAEDREHAFDASEKAIVDAGHLALNPVKEEPTKTGMTCTETETHLKQLWSAGEFNKYREVMGNIWVKDLENVRKADYLVLHFEEDDTSVGAPLEMTMASIVFLLQIAQKSCDANERTWLSAAKHALKKAGFYHKPIYWVCTGPISKINTTLKWLVLSGSDVRVFKTYKELTDHLRKVYK